MRVPFLDDLRPMRLPLDKEEKCYNEMVSFHILEISKRNDRSKSGRTALSIVIFLRYWVLEI